ncbi:N-acetylmuramoyl-L-alanine amidase [Clostridium tertium]|uniref:N-acetylmuramoyl-L-alanine amidase LytC n=1 Tax=Clostridium tertium TaxID=1559 RepID=A0A6N3BBN7_9CLOT
MNIPSFDLANKRKLLYKRKRRRKIIFRLTLLFTLIFCLSVYFILNSKGLINKKVTFAPSKEKDFIVCIDAGHGDFDIGSKGLSGSLEKDIVLNITLKLGELLEKENIKVVYTRTNDSLSWVDDANDSLKERIRISEAFNSDLFISIHCNSNYDNTSAKGIETWYKASDEKSKAFAENIQLSLENLNYTDNRGVKTYVKKEDALAVVELNSATSALVELGFLSNSLDERYLTLDSNQDKIAKALKEGIVEQLTINN